MQPALLTTIKQSITHLIKAFRLNLNEKKNHKGRPLKIENDDALALAVYQHTSTRATKKSVYDDFKTALGCSYKTLVCAMNRAGVRAMKILFLIMRLGKKQSHIVKYTDATDIPVCLKKNADSHRTMRGLADIGRSSKGWYYGVKMTITRDAKGQLLGLRFASPRTNDRDIFRSINADIDGIIVADAGYVSKQLEKEMNIENKRWVMIRPFKSMMRIMTKWQEKLYRSRFQIEFDFRSMKLFHGLVTSLPRSVNGYIANYLNAVLSFVIA
jgi:DDE family transposase